MDEIEQFSTQISQIIEIAFQTDLLALNAGVEAAGCRGGPWLRRGRLRSAGLAHRSAEAAKEIKAQISASTAQVASGVTAMAETGGALQRIMTQVAEITGIVTKIAASAHKQATGLHQVNSAVNQMDQVTQQNAAMVEQSTAASHSLAQEAGELTRLMTQFRTGEAARASAAAPAPRTQKAPARAAYSGNAAVKMSPAADGWEEF